MPLTKFLFANGNPNNGCHAHRIYWPWKYLEADFPELDVDLSVGDPVGDFEWFQTHGTPRLPMLGVVGGWKRRRGRWVWSVDDDYRQLPSFNPVKFSDDDANSFEAALDLADAILVSTPSLAATMGRPAKTLTAPNLMDVALYGVAEPRPFEAGKPLTVLWAGSNTHDGDLAVMGDAVDRLLAKWTPAKVEFVFVGYCPPRLLKRHLNEGVVYEPGVNFALYPKVLNAIRPHVVLAPLADHVFNASKSCIRIYEAWSLAAAVVASPVGEYRVVRDGVDGFFADSADEWFDRVDRLLTDHELRTTVAAEGRRRVRDFDWRNPASRAPWRAVVRELRRRSS